MAWEGLLFYGDNEIINTARSAAYARAMKLNWVKGCYDVPCLDDVAAGFDGESFGPGVGSGYTDPASDPAPWYDPYERGSDEFAGVVALEISGLEDSSRDAQAFEYTTPGGNPGHLRHSTKEVVFSAVLVGSSDCGVEYGFRWLKRALNHPQHPSCTLRADGSNRCFGPPLSFLACEPKCDAKQTVQTNLYTNPSFETGVGDWVEFGGANAPVTSTDQALVGTQSLHAVRGAGVSAFFATHAGVQNLLNGAGDYFISASVWVPSSVPLFSVIGFDVGGGGVVDVEPVMEVTGRDRWVTVGSSFEWNGVGNVEFNLFGDDSAAEMYVDAIIVTKGTTPVSYFDGDTTDTATDTYSWNGVAHESSSTRVTAPMVATGRHLRRAIIMRGPVVTGRRNIPGSCGGTFWQVSWTARVGDPFTYGDPVALLRGWGTGSYPYVAPYSGVYGEGTGRDYSTPLPSCLDPSTPSYVDPLIDPLCPPAPVPPLAPVTVWPCDPPEFGGFPGQSDMYIEIPSEAIPLWDEVRPMISATPTNLDARWVRFTYYDISEPLDSVCQSDWGLPDYFVAYVPQGATLHIDATSGQVTIDDGGVTYNAGNLVSDIWGGPASIGGLSCGKDYRLVVQTQAVETSPGVVESVEWDIDIDLVPRSA